MSAPGSQSGGWIANGTIQPSMVCKLDTTSGKNFYVVVCVSPTDKQQIGISQEGSYDAPGTTGAATDAARAGLPIKLFTEAEFCLVQLSNTAGCTAGDTLAVDATNGVVTSTPDGSVTPDTTATHYIMAIALETANAAEKVRCQVHKMKF
jgi:hypothetical protein